MVENKLILILVVFFNLPDNIFISFVLCKDPYLSEVTWIINEFSYLINNFSTFS